ncbi:MAG: chromosome partitioning protein ParB [Gemmatales bacterium]|nr:MAG: chromosome partitioning protein ParB [Gemmatales bacterium]
MEKRRLGRGLDALLGGADDIPKTEQEVPLEQIRHNPFQPRKDFDADELSSLSESIKTCGILQPLIVRPAADGFELVAGERRLRAAQAAGFTQVPVRIVDFNDQQTIEAALIENIQRTDLNPIEKAQGFRDYLERFNMTQEQLAARLGLDRSTISNLINLLELPAEVQEAVRLEQISLGHAKVLKGLSDPEEQIALCREIIARGHSVRAVEAIIREKRGSEPASRKQNPEKTNHVQMIEDDLRRKFATKVEIRLRGKEKGQFVIHFESNDDFERIVEMLLPQ